MFGAEIRNAREPNSRLCRGTELKRQVKHLLAFYINTLSFFSKQLMKLDDFRHA